jgi:hypothetical protein
MKKSITKKNTSSSKTKETYHQEIIVKPAKRLLEALLEAEQKEMAIPSKTRKATGSSR